MLKHLDRLRKNVPWYQRMGLEMVLPGILCLPSGIGKERLVQPFHSSRLQQSRAGSYPLCCWSLGMKNGLFLQAGAGTQPLPFAPQLHTPARAPAPGTKQPVQLPASEEPL